MQGRMAIAACLGIWLAGAGAAWAQDTRTTPEVLSLGARDAAPAPTILRGTPAERAAGPASEPTVERWQIVAGKRLWLVDRATAEVRSCINRDTSTVGVREIQCTSGEVGRFRRTFGRNFNP
ncbi:MAG TPA: hypothetical protein VLE23_20295 [Geminicoccaceae bacterium]|nr:hypothetical protein [Geminicoccaceae bacterium]